MNYLASTRIYKIWVAHSYYFPLREIVRLCMGESEIPHLRLWLYKSYGNLYKSYGHAATYSSSRTEFYSLELVL